MRKTTPLITVAGLALAAACHSTPPPETTPVQTTDPTPKVAAQNIFNQDSLDAFNKAAADSAERVRVAAAAAAARADSIEKARIAAQTNAAIRQELGTVVHFTVGQSRLQPEDQAALDRKVTILNANPAVRLRITGACDDRGSDQYNMALGERRAASVKQYLVKKGIDVARLDQMSSGEGSPVDAGSGETAWAQNRRAEFAIVGGDLQVSLNR